MKILQCGLAKSGNYWLYKIIQNILLEGGLPTNTYIETQPIYEIAKKWDLSFQERAKIDTVRIKNRQIRYRIGNFFAYPIFDLEEYLERTTHVWTHSDIQPCSVDFYSRFDKVIYIIRDPRDVLVSLANWSFGEYWTKYFSPKHNDIKTFLEQEALAHSRSWVKHVSGHLLEIENIHIVFYERLKANFSTELESLLEYLELPFDDDQKERIANAVQFDTMKAKNPRHLNKGIVGQWATTLDPKLVRTISRKAGLLMEYLNFPTDTGNHENPTPLPSLPKKLDKKILKSILVKADQSDIYEIMEFFKSKFLKYVRRLFP